MLTKRFMEIFSLNTKLRFISYLFLMLILALISGCRKGEYLDYDTVLGNHCNPKGSEDYNNLELREDKYFSFIQAPLHSSDIWRTFYGIYEIQDDRLILFENSDMSSFVEEASINGTVSDSITIEFTTDFLDYFKDLVIRIDDVEISFENAKNRVFFDRRNYVEKISIDRKNRFKDVASIYDYHSVWLSIRSGNYFLEIPIKLNQEQIKLSLNSQPTLVGQKVPLTAYKKFENILVSVKTSKNINRHKLNFRNCE